MAKPNPSPATSADIEALPPHVTGEIIFGSLVTQPRPAEEHAIAASSLGGVLHPPFQFGSGGGPGGWLIVDEHQIRLGPHVIVPDLAGWRRERLTGGPVADIVPDWICEVLSPSTGKRDRTDKMRIYAAYGVKFLWLLDPLDFVLEAYRLHEKSWLLVQTFSDQESVSAPPFDAISFPLGQLWPLASPSDSLEP